MVKRLFPFSFILLFVFLVLGQTRANAAKFTSTYLRLNNDAANQSIDATVCAEPSSPTAGTEAQVTITFPSGFSISSNTSNWTANTANLPQGATAWPGIGITATSVSAQSVTFASSDLTGNNLYCFNLTSSASNNGPAGTDEYGTITTKDSSNSTIDSTTYGVAVLTNNQISVNAYVGPQISDLPIGITSNRTNGTIPQNTQIHYTITYGLKTIDAWPVTIQAQWSQGTIEGSPSPSVELLSYVVGSASKAYGNTSPVIDPVNRTITWTINSFPGKTLNQEVDFWLQTNNNYTGQNKVDFTVSARSTSAPATTPDSTINQSYQYVIAPSPTSTPSPSPTVQAPSSSENALAINDIYLRSISMSDTQISVSTSNPSRLTLRYGTSPTALDSTINTASFQSQTLIDLPNLSPSTDYYFTVTAADKNGNTLTSDIFTFKTAVISPIPSVDLRTLLVISNDNVLLNPALLQNNQPLQNIIVIPTQTVFDLHFALDKQIALNNIQAIIRNKNVLGINTYDPQSANSNNADLTQVSPGIYTGKLLSPSPGEYEIYIRLADFNGNISEQKVSDLTVTNKFRIYKEGTKNEPIEHARMLLYLYDPTTRIYSVISPNTLSIQNPSYSNPDGTFSFALPQGQYRAEILALGYAPKNIDFQINPYSQNYPTVYLKAEPFNIIDLAKYYWGTLTDEINASQNFMRLQADSNRLFDLSAMGAVFLFIIFSTLSISARTHVPLFYLPFFLIFKLAILFRRHKAKVVYGKVIEEKTNLPVSRATIFLKTPDGKTQIAKLKTNKLGEFYFRNRNEKDYQITVSKPGFVLESPHEYKNSLTQIPAVLVLQKKGEPVHSLFEIVFVYTEDLFGLLMETLILVGLIVQIYFIFTFGLLRILPFIILTLFNIVLVFSYFYKPKGLEP